MRVFIVAATLALMSSPSFAGPGGPGDNRNGADAFREAVTACLVAGMAQPGADPVRLAETCIDAVQSIWTAAYGGGPCTPWQFP